ncbi:ribosomal protein L24E [Aspergillus welwitschiae]|uniref:Ribosomal protein L24E n=1 Tax=Aspergillus welwitschiae TaxID=1341132 RepID=A0A3F3Q2T2_9EURO|nr:ribosomal protein L24E [Aspergillus welwitschiae]RDH33534.1 ribosomal protein L24E [Aspergillus welwitschiae]
MTGMVQTDLAHPPAPKYKDEPVEDPHRHPGPQPPHLQHPRPTLLVQPQKQPESPHQPSTTLPSGSYAPHGLGNGVIHHPHSYGPPSEQSYYSSHSSYSTASAPSQYSSSGPPEMMATATQMQRPYPPIYHTPQSSSPASVASQTHEQHNRGIYTQSPQMTSQMYGYPPYSPMNPVQPPPYGPNTSPQQHPLTTQPLMVPHPTSTAQLPHHPAQAPTGNLSSSPNSAGAQQPTPPQRTMLNPPHSAASGAPLSASAVHHQNSNVGASSSAAPGPIPATTPLVVRQDSNGVQWIAFEYSRDRVKMEYTIRCDVESVNVDNLSQEFKTENCVYPRACCSKDQYRGNRLVYETECNAVGWALAELNPALRGKRGLIQRAVDSWRNSNQDPRLRSRRVRRMAKINKRQGMPVPPPHMAPSTPVGPGMTSASMPAPGPRPSLGPLPMGPPQLHHHHAQPEGSAGHEEASGTTDYANGTSRPPVSDGLQPGPSPTDIRTAQVFHGYPSYPTPATASGGPRGPSIPPLIRDSGIGSLGRHPTIATSSNRIEEVDDDDDERNPSSDALFGTLPEGKRRKFILVDDNQRGCRVRVKVMLDQVDMDEIPDSYRMSNAIYPRTYFPVQMRDPGRVVPGNRYIKDHIGADEGDDADDDDSPTVGRVMVPAPQIDGEGEIAVPRLSRGRRRREVLLNDLGYRMSWSQSRVFAGRMLFLQRSLDAYRNKMRSTMLAAGQDPTSIPRHFETRAGKRRFLERRRRAAGGPTRGAGAHGLSASQRSAEEVEA